MSKNMHTPTPGIAPEGYPVIGLCAFTAFIFAILACWPLALLFVLITWFSCHFFRDPERVVPQDANVAISPADGRVIRIERRTEPLTGQTCLCICVFMNVFSVHVNRSPVAGVVEQIRYFPGKFFNAAWDKAATDNERCAYLIRDDAGDAWGMVQIAGLIARRIVCRVEQGDALQRGQRFGLIRFGSRVDLYVPEGYNPTVGIGEQVYAGQSVVARKNL